MDLRGLGFSSVRYSEVILSVSLSGKVNSAPMGVVLRRGLPLLRVYKGSTTYRLLLEGAEDCVLNITHDPKLFYYALLKKERLKYVRSRIVASPRIVGCDGYVECRIVKVRRGQGRVYVTLEPLLATVKRRPARAYSRAGPALIEAMVYMTKLDAVGLSREEAEEMFLRVKLSVDTVYRTTRYRGYREMASHVLEEARRRLRRHSS